MLDSPSSLARQATARPSIASFSTTAPGGEVGSISERTQHSQQNQIVWHWGVDIMPLMDHGEHPPSGDAWSGDAALQAFKAAFFKWLNEQADD